jgi:NAD(P)-dependent dehydrogenase (short-subunit alcohol dehydrogenase family)
MKKHEGKVALVTESARGIGAAIAERACGLGRVRTTGAPLAEVDWETV